MRNSESVVTELDKGSMRSHSRHGAVVRHFGVLRVVR